MAIQPEIMEYITAHADKVVSEAKTILETVTNKDVEITFEGASEFEFETLSSHYAESVVNVSFSLTSDPEGLVELFVDKESAARIGSLMMMMDEEKPEFNEEHVDAVKETVNQVLGSISTNLSEALGYSISFDNLKAEEAELKEDSFSLPDLVSGQFSLTIGDDEPKTLYSVLTSSSIASIMGEEAAEEATESADEEATAEAEDAGEEETAVEEAEGEEEAAADAPGEEGSQDELSEDALAEIGSDIGADVEEGEDVNTGDIDSMLGGGPDIGVEDVAVSETPAPPQAPPGVEPKMEFLMDLKFPVSIELGRTKMLIKDILDLGHGSVIEFDKLANEPVDLLIDDKKIAEGEVVVIDEHFGIRITNLIHAAEFLKSIGGKNR
ncbi:flagellar motor switch protein FliN [candidate division KSB1 bacterium]